MDISEVLKNKAHLRGAHLRGAHLSGAIVPFAMPYGKYVLNYRADEDDIEFIAGCRRFSIDEAREHWGSADYPDAARGERMMETCEMLYRWWERGILLGVKSGKSGEWR